MQNLSFAEVRSATKHPQINDGSIRQPAPPTLRTACGSRAASICRHTGLALIVTLAVIFPFHFGLFFTVNVNSNCRPDGKYDPEYSSNNWRNLDIFSVTNGFGDLPFPVAKAIDLTWDVVVGRGIQVFLAWIAYRVFTKSLLGVMEHTPILYDSFAAVTLQTASLKSIATLIRGFTFSKGLRARIVILWIIVASAYVVAFPTLMSAATSFTTRYEHFVTISNDQLVPFAEFASTDNSTYVIADGDRIGLTKDFRFDAHSGGASLTNGSSSEENSCNLNAILDYLQKYGSGIQKSSIWQSNTAASSDCTATSLGKTTFLPPPTLNISLPWQYLHDSQPYSNTYITTNSVCLPGRTYQWGFSFYLSFILSIFHAIWTLGMYIMWMDAHRNSRLAHHAGQVEVGGRSAIRVGTTMGMFKAVMDLSQAIRDEFGNQAQTWTDEQLVHKLGHATKGMVYATKGISLSRAQDSMLKKQRKKMMMDL